MEKKREILEEQIKQALTSTFKVISNHIEDKNSKIKDLEIKTLDFDKDSDEFAQFCVAFPKSWNEGTVTFQAFFTANSTNTGDVVWTLAGTALADNGSLNTAFGTAVATTGKAHSGTANDLDVTAESGAVTIAGSPSTDEYVFFEIKRDVSEDSLTADAKLLGVKLFFTTDAGNDT